VELVSSTRCFDGEQRRYKHAAKSLNCDMHFSIYLPPQMLGREVKGQTLQPGQETPPVLYWLSGLTCSDENFVQKAGAQQFAAKYGVAIVCPDTSPRGNSDTGLDRDGATVPDDAEGAWDFGLGAGFYVNATQAPWDKHYRMYDYVSGELPALINEHFGVNTERAGIFGHSMGGHGALTIGMRNPDKFQSISAFAPICAPSDCEWGKKALSHYLGDDDTNWIEYDACSLVRALGKTDSRPLFIDQGLDDNYMVEQLKPELLEKACRDAGRFVMLRRREGYDHSYSFVASFIEDHIRFHAQQLTR